ncbi:MAG: hypothetical protein ACXV9R_10330 [Methylobacter sp.]
MSEARNLLKQIIDWHHNKNATSTEFGHLIEDAEALLARPEPEPVAYIIERNLNMLRERKTFTSATLFFDSEDGLIPLYAEPLEQFNPDLANYRQGKDDGKAEALAELEQIKAERDALKARIDDGVRVSYWRKMGGKLMAMEVVDGIDSDPINATLILDAPGQQLSEPQKRNTWQPIETAPDNEMLLLAAEFDGPGDWRIKIGYRDTENRSGHWSVFGASWIPTRWMPLPDAPEQGVK